MTGADATREERSRHRPRGSVRAVVSRFFVLARLLGPLSGTLSIVALAALATGCKPSRAQVRADLEDRGYHAVEVDPADNELGVFHFTAKRSFEDCRGTVVTGQKLISVTCSVRSEVSSPLASTDPH